ncbi:unnamed protein product [Agarophyton chilense]|eukprot:gb/GEZJ01002855.1/.p1 GENE.gb/GEZJ01002855.1/~~gb/GEZJ01002855.1/.p1  ORF type:complete len:425 (-),score=59.36 gb/GEZJ01002855.1/:1849-3123(-)
MPQISVVASKELHAEHKNAIEAFHKARSLYLDVARLHRHSRIFLPRTLRKTSEQRQKLSALPGVEYVSIEPFVTWSQHVPEMRCLWCGDRFYRFSCAAELLLHLRTSHGRFEYDLINSSESKTIRSRHDKEVFLLIHLKLQREGELPLVSPCGLSHPYDMEFMYYKSPGFHNPVRKPARTNPSPSLNGILLNEPHRRPRRSTHEQEESQDKIKEGGKKKRRGAEIKDKDYRPAKCAKRSVENKKKKKVGKPAFKTLSTAVKEKRLYNSVVQRELLVEEYENGADSDAESESQEEVKWRLRVVDDEIEEYVDTIAVEKLFMNLWNQFVKMEHPVKSDKEIAPACLSFVQKYRKTLIRYNLEVTFLRHLAEFSRMGLLDADGVFDICRVLRNRDMSGPSDGSDEPKFLYGERLLKEGPEGKRIRYA